MKRKPPPTCIFCKQPGVTAEHIWSDWLNAEIGSLTTGKGHSIIDMMTLPGNVVAAGPRKSPMKPGPLGAKRVRKPCKACNNGWMSDIVQKSKPSAIAMVHDKSVVVGLAEIRSLFRWIAMSTLMAEFLDPPTATVSEEEIAHFYEYKNLPPWWFISLGRYSGETWSPRGYRHYGTKMGIGGDVFGFQQTTYVLKHLVVNCFSCKVPGVHRMMLERILPEKLVHLNPVNGREFQWPCTEVLGDADLDRIFNFSMEVMLAIRPR